MKNYQEPLKLAFIGGSIHSAIGYTHYIASQMDHLFTLNAGCFSRDENINKKTALTWGVDATHLYDNWQELLEKEQKNIDAVVILTPTPKHYKMIIMALEYGYSVISEKALAMSFEEGKQISQKIEEKKSFFAVTHNYTGYPMLRELQHMIKIGKLGKIIDVNIEMPQESFIRLNSDGDKQKPQNWRLKDGKISGISLDLAAHLQHMIYFLTGENPIEVVADEASYGHFHDVVDDITCLARYNSGMKTTMWYGKSMIGHRNGLRVRVYGEKGSAEWFQMQPEELLFNTAYGDRVVLDRASNVNIVNLSRYTRFKAGHPAGFIEAFGNLYFDIAEKLRQYKMNKNHNIKWSYDAKQATIGLEVFEAIEKSFSTNRWIRIKG